MFELPLLSASCAASVAMCTPLIASICSNRQENIVAVKVVRHLELEHDIKDSSTKVQARHCAIDKDGALRPQGCKERSSQVPANSIHSSICTFPVCDIRNSLDYISTDLSIGHNDLISPA